ncbi:MAG: MATE family efflux transporter [Clostridia bacterium]|nr:MATE family efflux transporter [Clostridia bacterium]
MPGNATVDLTKGPLFKNIVKFTIPIIFTGILQLFFNAADIVVVGRFASETALAAVTSTGALINLIVNFAIGLSVGAGVCMAKCFGSKDADGMEQTVHTAMLTSVIGGVAVGVSGFIFSKYFLVWMDTPSNVIDQATLYVRIYFTGVPFSIIYNFGAAVLRAVGDTRRPLLFLVTAGIINVLFNLAFVLIFGMDVDGVAYATVISQVVSCVLVTAYLMKVKDYHRLDIKKLRIVKDKFTQILIVGLPAGVQGSLFSISNVIIQSSINSFGDVAMSGNGAAANIEGFVYISMNAFHQTALSFTGQHVGAKKVYRTGKIALLCLACVTVVGGVSGVGAYLMGRPLISVYVGDNNTEVIKYGIIRMTYVCVPYFLCGLMDVFSGLLRGLNRSVEATFITLVCVCVLRLVWIYTVFAENHTLPVLYFSYPLSWGICVLAQAGMFWAAYAKAKKREREESAES